MNAWTTLGLKRTADVAEIRRAYARRLKATDVDANPAAFIALREALERALNYAASRQNRPRAAEVEAEPEGDFVPFEPMADAPVAVAPASGESGAVHDANEDGARFARLEALLFAEGQESLDPEALVAAVREVIEHPDMGHIEHEASVQHWLADVFDASTPRSDPVLAMVVDRFNWEESADAFDQPWLFQRVVERHRALELIAQLGDPKHRYHKAWRDLVRPDERLGLKPMGLAEDVRNLLTLIRERCPPAEEKLASHRVALWDAKLNRYGPGLTIRTIIIGLWILWVLSKIATCSAQEAVRSSGEPSVVPFTTQSELPTAPEQDVGSVLNVALGHGGYARLEESHPTLHARLVTRWREARDAGQDINTFRLAMADLLDEATVEGLRGGSPSLQLAYWVLHVDRLRWIRDHAPGDGPTACGEYVRDGARTIDLPSNLDDRQREIFSRALLEPPSQPVMRSADGRFSVPGNLIDAALERSRLDVATFQSALRNEGSYPEACAARIALIEAALNLSMEQRTSFLREMSRSL